MENRKDGRCVAFGDNIKSFIKGVRKLGKSNSAQIENVYYVKMLKHNLLSIIQLCGNDHEVKFEPNACLIKESIGKVLFSGLRERNLYRICIESLPSQSYLASFRTDKWLWHRMVGHLNMKTLSRLSKHNIVRGLPNISMRKIEYVRLVSRVNKPNLFSTLNMQYHPRKSQSFCIFTHLDQPKHLAWVGRDMDL